MASYVILSFHKLLQEDGVGEEGRTETKGGRDGGIKAEVSNEEQRDEGRGKTGTREVRELAVKERRKKRRNMKKRQ